MTKVIMDTDPGTDDALALMMALNSPELEVLGLTTVGGNASLANTTRNALRLLAYLGRPEIPVSRGAARPLKGKFEYAPYFHGPGGLTVRLPPTHLEPIGLRAVDCIMEATRSMPGELVILGLGPLTNVARAISREPRVADWIKEIVVMGGAIEVPGNVTSYAEFNIYNDPAAAAFVFSSGVAVTLVGLDVCNQVYLDADDRGWISGASRSERLAEDIVSSWFPLHPLGSQYNLCDPLAVAAALRPSLFSYRKAAVDVEMDNKERIGQTRASYGDGFVNVATGVRVAEAKELIRRLLKSRKPV